MAPNSRQRQHIVAICKILAQQKDLKVAIEESSAIGPRTTGTNTLIGGLLAGPVIAFGTSVTRVVVQGPAKANFKSVVEIINEMSDDEKNRLCNAIERALLEIGPEDDIMLIASSALNSTSVEELVLRQLGNFFKEELQLRIRF